jgi:hypothetical protein
MEGYSLSHIFENEKLCPGATNFSPGRTVYSSEQYGFLCPLRCETSTSVSIPKQSVTMVVTAHSTVLVDLSGENICQMIRINEPRSSTISLHTHTVLPQRITPKGDRKTGHEYSRQALEHSAKAYEFAREANRKSEGALDKNQ